MSPRARSAATQFLVMAVIWVVAQRLLDLTPWARRESWGEMVVTALLFGAAMAVWEWFRWERRRSSRAVR
jgi:hypothetical protein